MVSYRTSIREQAVVHPIISLKPLFWKKEKAHHRPVRSYRQFGIGWISHLYYWIYPGIMVAFFGNFDCVHLRLFGICTERSGGKYWSP